MLERKMHLALLPFNDSPPTLFEQLLIEKSYLPLVAFAE